MWQLAKFTEEANIPEHDKGRTVWVEAGPPRLISSGPINHFYVTEGLKYISNVRNPIKGARPLLNIPKDYLELLGEFKEEVDIVSLEEWEKGE